jgi:hypothetical protein
MVSLRQQIARNNGHNQRSPLGAEIYQADRHATDERALEARGAAEQGLPCE